MRAVEYLEQLGEGVRQAALERDSMQAAVSRYLEGIPARAASGRTPRRTEIQPRMPRHLVIREQHLEQRRHAGGRDFVLAGMGFALKGICPICGSSTPPAQAPSCEHMEGGIPEGMAPSE